MPAAKDKTNKPDLSLIPYCVEVELARAMMNGEEKYGRFNYTKGHKVSELAAAAKRHIGQFLDGQDRAADSGVHHLAHAMANCLMIIHEQMLGTLKDDRFRSAPEQTTAPEYSFGDELLTAIQEYEDRSYEIVARSNISGEEFVVEAAPDLTLAQARLRTMERDWPTFTLVIREVDDGHQEVS